MSRQKKQRKPQRKAASSLKGFKLVKNAKTQVYEKSGQVIEDRDHRVERNSFYTWPGRQVRKQEHLGLNPSPYYVGSGGRIS